MLFLWGHFAAADWSTNIKIHHNIIPFISSYTLLFSNYFQNHKKHYPDKLRQNSVLSNSGAIAMLR
ncbi:conserved hypothetical protein [Brochothrix thermosphacta]|nr:conserved hypothetical protein [Brochothrix thermosphacta]SPP29311.1 conserved hypothetical protein [Brochothrix thermosphacta]